MMNELRFPGSLGSTVDFLSQTWLVAAMHEIADWLKGIGFEQYTRCVADNDIDFSRLTLTL